MSTTSGLTGRPRAGAAKIAIPRGPRKGSTARPYQVLELRMSGSPWKVLATDAGITIGAASCYLARALRRLGVPDFPTAAVAWRAHLAGASSELTETQRAAVTWSSGGAACMKIRGDGNYRAAMRGGNLSVMNATTTPSAGQALRAYREVRGLSASAIAREAGVSRQRITSVEGFPRVTVRQAERYIRAAERAYDQRLARVAGKLVREEAP